MSETGGFTTCSWGNACSGWPELLTRDEALQRLRESATASIRKAEATLAALDAGEVVVYLGRYRPSIPTGEDQEMPS